jgi:FkbM family methyltransferase
MSIREHIRNYLSRKLGVPEIPTALERLNEIGFIPNQIFDVGAYQGDFANLCLNIWSETKVACFEALEPKVEQLNLLASREKSITVFPTLLGAKSQNNVPLNLAETASSVLNEQVEQSFSVQICQMRTIDEVVAEDFYGVAPDFLKIDVQGYELEVLKGAEKTLPQIQVILAEINFLDIHQNVPLLADIVTWLNERNWVAYDICALTRRPLDKALWQADFIFVPENSPLRNNKRWNS